MPGAQLDDVEKKKKKRMSAAPPQGFRRDHRRLLEMVDTDG